ncbi:MAG: hypothetical protein QM783_03945 [Phycisphaerales bacterium]
MSTASRPFAKLPTPVKRLVFCSFGVVAFLSISAVLHPERSMADVRREAAMRESRLVPVAEGSHAGAKSNAVFQPPRVTSTRPLIGTLTGSPYFVWVYAGASGPVYTVANHEGKILAVELDADALYAQLPEVSVQTLQLHTGEPGPLMMVDPDKQQQP